MSFIDQPGFADDVRAVMRDLLALPPAFMDYTVQYNALNGLPIPISQITGFAQFSANAAPITSGTGTVTVSTYGDCSDGAGPTISALPDGKYVLLYGASAKSSVATGECIISPKINTTEASDNDLAVMNGTAESVLFGFSNQSLSNGNSNTVVLRYRTGATASTATFRYRRIMAIKYANL